MVGANSLSMLLSLLSFFYFVASEELFQYDPATCRNAALMKSTWPSDHGDSSRSKFTYGAGLPKDIQSNDLKVTEQTSVEKVQWIYTYGNDSETLFIMGGTIIENYAAKLDAITLEVQQKIDMEPNLYMGGMLMHGNGHVYAIHANTLYKFWYGDLFNSTKLKIPSKMNGDIVQTNGMVISSDGFIVLKQWSYLLEDLHYFTTPVPFLKRLVIGLLVLGATVGVMMLPRNKSGMFYVIFAAAMGGIIAALGVYTIVVMILRRNFGSFDPIQFAMTNLVLRNYGGGGELKLIDPDTMKVRKELFLKERCSYGRIALARVPSLRPVRSNSHTDGFPTENGSISTTEDAIVLVGDEFIHQYRWNAQNDELYEIEDWAERYRRRYEGTFPGTGPAIYKGVTYFTDNTFPIELHGQSYTLFRKPLYDNGVGSTGLRMTKMRLTDPGVAGFMFWSVVVSPIDNSLVVWDSPSHSVQMRNMEDLSLTWNISAIEGDCISIAADKGHLYFTDYNKGPNVPADWTRSIAKGGANMFPGLNKYFVVANTSTGDIIANVTISTGTTVFASGIVPGGHNDVFLGGKSGLIRIHT